ncbi:MAG TPA: cytochrome c oxidase subunit II, partial [Bacteroidia bacterium]
MILLFLLAIVLLCIASNQLFRVSELSRDLQEEKTQTPTDSENRFNGRSMLLFMLLFFGFFLWQINHYYYRILPQSASEHGNKIDALMNANYLLIVAVFFLVHIFLFFFAWKYHGKKGRKASYIMHNNKLEMLWTTVPAVALAFIIIFGLKYWNEIMKRSDDPNPIKVELYAKQFDWTARYPGKDKQFGIDNYMQIDGSNPIGLDTGDARCHDDVLVKNEFHIPVNREVIFQFRSRDVIHSAFMPHFRAQMNCVPGQVTNFRFKPTVTTADMRKDAHVLRNIN